DACAIAMECVSGICRDRADPSCVLSASDCPHDMECAMINESHCLTRLPEGAQCNGDECFSGLFCNFSTFPAICSSRHSEGDSCNGTEQCIDGLVCDFSISFPGRCIVAPGLDEPCDAGVCQPD